MNRTQRGRFDKHKEQKAWCLGVGVLGYALPRRLPVVQKLPEMDPGESECGDM